MPTIGEQIKLARESKDMSQEELGRRVNTTKQTIYKYETGKITNIPVERFRAICEVLDLDPAEMLGWLSAPIFVEKTFNAADTMSVIRREAHEAIDSMDEEKLKKLLQVFELVKDM